MTKNSPNNADYFVDYFKDAAGNTNAVDNYVGNPTEFIIRPPAGTTYYVDTFTSHFKNRNSNSKEFPAIDYGPIGSALPIGLTFKVKKADNTVLLDLFPLGNIKRIIHWYHFSTTHQISDSPNREVFHNIKWHIYSTTGYYLKLTHAEKLVITVQDNFLPLLDRQRFLVQGLKK